MNKTIAHNKVLDEKGRLLIPRSLRAAAGMEHGDIIRLGIQNGVITARKLDIVEIGDQSPKARDAYVFAAVRFMDRDALLELIAEIAARVRLEGSS